MSNRPTVTIIEIQSSYKYVTRQMGVSDLECKLLERLRFLMNRGHYSFTVTVKETCIIVTPVAEEGLIK